MSDDTNATVAASSAASTELPAFTDAETKFLITMLQHLTSDVQVDMSLFLDFT